MTESDEQFGAPVGEFPRVCSLAEDGSSADGQFRISFLRRVEPKEEEAIRRANDLVVLLARDQAYGRCVALLGVVQGHLRELVAMPPPVSLQLPPLISALKGLVVALHTCADQLAKAVEDSSVAERPEFRQLLAEARSSPEWRLLSALANASLETYRYHETGRILWQRDDSQLIDVWDLANRAVWFAQVLQVRHFWALRDVITKACQILRQLSVEVPSGRIALVGHADIGPDDPLSELKMQPMPIALDDIPAVMTAVGEAELFETDREASEAAAVTHEVPDQSGAEPIHAADSPADESDEDDDPDPLGEPVDVDGLFSVVSALVPELEREWSRALEEAALTPALAKQVAGLWSLLTALQKRFVEDRLLNLLGLDGALAEWPLSPARLGMVDVEPDSLERAEEQLRWAQLGAMEDLVEASRALREPTTTTIHIGPPERVERFWDAGGFRLVEDRLRHLKRLMDSHRRLLSQLAEGASGDHPDRLSWERLKLAERALLAGDPEAAIFHAHRSIAATFSDVSGDKLPAAVVAALAERPTVAVFAPAAERALEAGHRLREGGSIDLGAASLLAEIAVGVAGAVQMPDMPAPSGSLNDLAEEIEQRQNRVHPIEDDDDDA